MDFLPNPVLDHLDRMTDSTGLIQHAIDSVPRPDSGFQGRDRRLPPRLRPFVTNDGSGVASRKTPFLR
jgi:hypothetical protein